MQGVKVIEVAQFTFVPAAGAVLADWGADVIKIEHPERGDTQRGFINLDGMAVEPNRHILMEHANRGKRSVGIDLSQAEGQQLLYRLVAECDVFLTNYLPSARRKCKIDYEDIKAHNPTIVYARGSALGDKGPEREQGGFDATAFWARGGSSLTVTPEELDGPLQQPGGAYGDSIGGMNIAGGISAALFHRERTGEGCVLDVSLLSSGVWATALTVDMAMEHQKATKKPPMPGKDINKNPLIGNFKTADGKYINLTILTPDKHIRQLFECLGVSELADDSRFSCAAALMENNIEAHQQIAQAFAAQPFKCWIDRLDGVNFQWAAFQNGLDASQDRQVLANDMIVEVDAIDGGRPIRLVANPVQFNGEKVETERSPQASEHTEMVLMDLGIEWDEIEKLKERGAIA
ncbi:MAG: CoA transferase [Pseudomonadales bacterium]|nr:MAG: CoA transferase [Pseudomonadales bacterium]